jgi:hypothetical protein
MCQPLSARDVWTVKRQGCVNRSCHRTGSTPGQTEENQEKILLQDSWRISQGHHDHDQKNLKNSAAVCEYQWEREGDGRISAHPVVYRDAGRRMACVAVIRHTPARLSDTAQTDVTSPLASALGTRNRVGYTKTSGKCTGSCDFRVVRQAMNSSADSCGSNSKKQIFFLGAFLEKITLARLPKKVLSFDGTADFFTVRNRRLPPWFNSVSSVFLVITRSKIVWYRRFGTTYRSHLGKDQVAQTVKFLGKTLEDRTDK